MSRDLAAMQVEIWHNPACGTSRNALALIRHVGIEPVVVDYLRDPPDVARLRQAIGLGHLRLYFQPQIDLATGRLQALLPDVAGEATPLNLVCTHRAQVTPLVLQLRDFLREQCAALA